VFGLAMAGGPFKAAQQALLPEVLRGDRYRVGLALRTVSTQTAQLAGFAVGGSVLLLVPVQTALGINASTFVLSAVIARMGVRARPAPAGAPRTVDHPRHRSAIMVLAGNRRLLVLAGLTWLAGLTVAPEGVAAPYAAGFGGSAVAVGLLLAADPLGGALGGWLFGRWQSRVARTKAMVPLAVLSGLALVPCALRPGLLPSVALWASSGAFSTLVLLHSHALLMRWVPNARRAAVAGLVSAGLQTSQGLAVLAAGLLGQQVGVYRAVAVIGAITVAIAVMLGLMWQRRAQPRVARTIRDGHGFGHGMRLRRSDVTVAHSGASLPGSSDSDKAGGA
jgi:predicted MFS family arabinose efflux permease